MVASPDTQQVIDYLFDRRFPLAKAQSDAPINVRSSNFVAVPQAETAAMTAYRDELNKLDPGELWNCYCAERENEPAEQRAKAEREERERFFNQPYAQADFDHWSKATYWTLDEAIALSFGKAPEHVTWEGVKPFASVSPFAFQYQRRRVLAGRALPRKPSFDAVAPDIFLAWTKKNDLAVPAELEEAVAARGHLLVDWKALFDELKAASDKDRERWVALSKEKSEQVGQLSARVEELQAQLASESASEASATPEKSLGARERESLLKLVIGMAIGGYGYDPKASRSDQPGAIATDLVTSGVPLDVDTVRKWLKEAAGLLSLAETEQHQP